MISSNFDVVIVGGGCAGMTAAIGLARAGVSVAVVEAAAFPGAENWSGCVYFCENLAHPDILGPDGVEALAWERRLVERGFFATDGHGLLGMTYRDPAAFSHCYTVLRPIFDHHLALIGARMGVALLNETTAESLLRDGGRVIGVATNRGPLYADLVYLAEGDASHLVTREGYERYADQREAPRFLQGIKEVIELPAGAIEEMFGVGADEGVAYEMLLRNGTLRGKPVHLNMGGFVYANRQSLSVGLVLPADNLAQHFDGDPNLLLEWFERLPAVAPWLKHGRRGAFGAKLIRGGGAKDIPRLVDDGLAIGGAASAVGIDFPFPNFTGPATRMGLLLVQAVRRIKEAKAGFTAANLTRHYLEPLQATHYWSDVEFLRRWPSYVKRSPVFFGRHIDVALGSAYVWTRPDRWFVRKWLSWIRLTGEVAGPAHWRELRADARVLARALRLREVVGQPRIWQLLLDGTVNALRDLFGSPRPDVAPSGRLHLHCRVAGGAEPTAAPAPLLRRWAQRFLPVLATAARRVYANDEEPLPAKLRGAINVLVRQVNILDVFAAALLGLAAGVTYLFLAVWARVWSLFSRRPPAALPGIYQRYASALAQTTDLTPVVAPAAQQWEDRLGQLAYQTVKESHIHVLWPRQLQNRAGAGQAGLWHVCPAQVYEARPGPQGQLQVVVNFENCIKCETCWRTSDLVDWGRDGRHRFIYPVHSPAVTRLLAAAHAASAARPMLPLTVDGWSAALTELAGHLQGERPGALNGPVALDAGEVVALLVQLERKLAEFDDALAAEPRTIDRARAEHLELLARYAQQLAARAAELVAGGSFADSPRPGLRQVQQRLAALVSAVGKRCEERTRRTALGRFAWAAADGRALRQHHLVGLRRTLALLNPPEPPAPALSSWLRAESDHAASAALRRAWATRLDGVFPRGAWRDLERGTPLTEAQDELLRALLAAVPAVDPDDLPATLHPPARKALLAELGRRDPSLAYRAAAHLWARDLARLASPGASFLARAAARWERGDEWACFTALDGAPATAAGWHGVALFVPAASARQVLFLLGDHLLILPTDAAPAGLHIEPLGTLGLRGAGLARLRLDNLALPAEHAAVDQARIRRAWAILASADLTAIASGMADVLCERAIAHAAGRVQFPGLFQDEDARDAIAKFGAVKKMLAEMAARRWLLETLDHVLSPVDFSAPSAEQAGLVKAITAAALGCAPGSLSYNAGQVFGGTGFSEDDILAKFYRDAAAWRFLGPTNVDILRHHGEDLLQGWRADGQRLAAFAAEADGFEVLNQRKALQPELDAVRVFRAHLRGLVNEWLAASGALPAAAPPAEQRVTFSPRARAEVAEGLARQNAHLLASKALLLRLHARLEQGVPSETETALLRVWLRGAAVGLEEFEGGLRMQFLLASPRAEPPAAAPPPAVTYAGFLAAAAPYDSGDFLANPVDEAVPRYVPELVEIDPELAAINRALRAQIAGWFGQARAGGLPYERHVESQHRPDTADLDFCRQHDYFRYPIPTAFGGAARRKADYYLLTTNCQRLADVAISLTIQVNSSLGTTPVLMAWAKDVPRAQKEVAAFASAAALQADVQGQLDKLAARCGQGEPAAFERSYRALQDQAEAQLLRSSAVKALAHRFLAAWQAAGLAARQFDWDAARRQLEQASAEWRTVCDQAGEYAEELARRREASELFLRWVASGQISAFALTEPSAGSDTARVATRAVLRSVAVTKDADGTLRFVPHGGKEPRCLLDARRLEFADQRPAYRWSPDAPAAPLQFDDYDYETDDPRRFRSYDHGGRRQTFTDMAQLRERDGKLWYDYWELTGAKMWITNGRMCGIMCLYAKTAEGITGFIVDRHAEGLIVGKDEDKLGQCGSPTNELALQAVRVPRENVIGIEGRGQVNALETLNVGRTGLAMSAMAQLEGLIEQSRAFAQANHGDIPDWVAWRLARMEEERFTAEALAYDVIGRFEHPLTKSVRLESAIAKALVSEALHRVIELAEDIHGLAGQTTAHLVEKRKRDARVLNIYEGTNEIQRFFILKDLAAAPPGREEPQPATGSADAAQVEALRLSVRQRVAAAVGAFGQELWQNPSLQANCFLLAEAVAWLKAADSTLGRAAFRQRVSDGPWAGGSDEPARRALARCSYEVRNRLRAFDEELNDLRRGLYAAEVRAARLLLLQAAAVPAVPPLASEITQPLTVLVVLEPTAALVPQLHVEDGRLAEAHWGLTAADGAALEAALLLRDQTAAPVSVQVVAVGPRQAAAALRPIVSLGIERVRLLVADSDPVPPDRAALALAALLHDAGPFDLLLGGQGDAGAEQGVLAQLLAAALRIPHAGSVNQLAVRWTESAREILLRSADQEHTRPLPAAVSLAGERALRDFTTAGYLVGLPRAVEFERWPRQVPQRTLTLALARQTATAGSAETTRTLQPTEAAATLLEALGRAGGTASAPAFAGEIEPLDTAPALSGVSVAIVAADADGRLGHGATAVLHAIAGLAPDAAIALVLTSEEESAQRQAVGQVRAQFGGRVVLLSASTASDAGRGHLLRESWPPDARPRWVIGEAWTEAALASLAFAAHQPETVVALRVRRLAVEEGRLLLETDRAQGRLRAVQEVGVGEALGWISLTAEAEVAPCGTASGDERVQRWTPRVERFRQLLDDVKAAAGVPTLANADFIIDVGYGVGNRDGYEAVIEPLERALKELGVANVTIGGSRKVTEELHLLPADRQIGQSGVSVNPRIMLAIGVSGAPQHLNCIGSRAVILAFNRDGEAPLLTLNRRQARPRVFPVVGDLFETVPALIAALRSAGVQELDVASNRN